MTTDLLDAVNTLTKEQHENIAQKNDDGRWLKAHTVTHPCLLQRMHDTVTPSSKRDTSSASSASTRAPLNLELATYIVITRQFGSTSLLQRTLWVGYRRAVAIMNEFEARGIVGPADGAKPREVLVRAESISVKEIVHG
ncbi:DNA translocase FtsK [Microbacterium sp. 20-116]|uniref:DNA translocase FtsK n=1 Tax=Microbacterium sp. 20-116 TaxID=3239883 RepID=UPI0034E28C47